MKKEILHVVHFSNSSGGGVFSVIKNLIKFSTNKNIHNHIVYTINKDITPHFIRDDVEGVSSQKLFYYSAKNNFYYTCKQLAKLLPSDNAIIVAHDWLELGMASNLGLQNPVVHFLHGDYDYYYDLANKNKLVIDAFVAVANSIKIKLSSTIKDTGDIHYLRFPVMDSCCETNEEDGFNVVFVGRLTIDKGFHIVKEIAKETFKLYPNIKFHIVGKMENDCCMSAWKHDSNVFFYGEMDNKEVLRLLCKMNIILLPSIAEGMPVCLVEAMKVGVVPIVNDINGGIQELVENNKTGYKIVNNLAKDYVSKIDLLFNDYNLRKNIGNNSRAIANSYFNPVTNTKAIENVYDIVQNKKKIKISKKVYGSMLDEKWIPNCLTYFYRKFNG